MPIRPCLSLATVVAVAGCSAPATETDQVQANTGGTVPEAQAPADTDMTV